MAGITLSEAEAQLASWIAASTAVASGQSYSIKDRSLSRVDAQEIRNQIDYWQSWVERLTPRTRGRTRYVVNQ
jgi:hypothetical protein